MNNEPVAWGMLDKDGGIYDSICPEEHDREEGLYTIPLYTHPAKESKAKDRFSNYESICLQCGTTIYKPAFKTLTDEEKDELISEFLGEYYKGDIVLHQMISAILKKASEK
jgi:hypothetical protein